MVLYKYYTEVFLITFDIIVNKIRLYNIDITQWTKCHLARLACRQLQ
jgi:hypothetical protein